jgi:hypothetical protein
MRPWIAVAFVALGFACGERVDSPPADSATLAPDPLDCLVPLAATDDDGAPWPAYSEKLAEFENCKDGTQSLGGYPLVARRDCADGKKLLVAAVIYGVASYYYDGELLVGRWLRSDTGGACGSNRPEGTPDSVRCDEVASTAIDCSSVLPLHARGHAVRGDPAAGVRG